MRFVLKLAANRGYQVHRLKFVLHFSRTFSSLRPDPRNMLRIDPRCVPRKEPPTSILAIHNAGCAYRSTWIAYITQFWYVARLLLILMNLYD